MAPKVPWIHWCIKVTLRIDQGDREGHPLQVLFMLQGRSDVRRPGCHCRVRCRVRGWQRDISRARPEGGGRRELANHRRRVE